jgi:hypothetical protein
MIICTISPNKYKNIAKFPIIIYRIKKWKTIKSLEIEDILINMVFRKLSYPK